MIICVCEIELEIFGADSLKAKRQVVKSVTTRLRNKFNISIAEVDQLDAYQLAVLGVAVVSNSQDHAHRQITKVVKWLESNRLDCAVIDYHIEMI